MAKVKTFKAEYGMSIEIRGVWHKFGCSVEVEAEPDDDPVKLKEKTWNTVLLEIEKQVKIVLDTP